MASSLAHEEQPASAVAAAGDATPLLSIRDVTVRFGGVTALQEVSFDVERGSICGLIGPNGAGKTTMFNCISRLVQPAGGTMHFDGHRLDEAAVHEVAALGIARTFQNLALFGTLTVLENVLVGSHCRTSGKFLANAFATPGLRRQEAAARREAEELLDFVELSHAAHRIVAELPFAYQKRVELARALASRPLLLLLDEPAAGLNREELDAIARMIRRVRSRHGISILIVEHNMGLVMSLCEKIVTLDFGCKIAEGAPEEIQRHPDVLRAYLGTAQ